MGYWGVKSYETDEAHDALDAAMELVHADRYDELMDDDNPLSVEQVHETLADERTLAQALAILRDQFGADAAAWDDDEAKLGFVGIIVRHAEKGIAIAPADRDQAIAWLEGEELEWDDDAARQGRRAEEIALLRKA